MKKCCRCKRELDRKMFFNNKSKKDGLSYTCKECSKEYMKEYCQNNREKINKHKKEYWQNNREQRHKYAKEYRQNNKKKIKEHDKEYRNKNKVKRFEYNKLYYQNNHEKVIECCRIYSLNRRHNDIEYKLKWNLRIRLRSAIKNNSKSGSAVRDLGCTIPEVRQYIEKQFKEGMTWDNWSFNGWHIDHIIPLDYFDLTNREQLLKAVHYTNLQPMWAEENLSKGCKLDFQLK